MSLYVLDCGSAQKQDLKVLRASGEFRKSTHNMLLAYAAVMDFKNPLTALISDLREETAIILGSSHGELAVTTEFLEHLAKQNIARPILFQNSLHNSTIGFLTLKFGMPGPAVTVSNHYFTGENCLDLAHTLLSEGDASLCVVVSVDTLVPQLSKTMELIYPKGLQLSEGAGALLLANERGLALTKDLRKGPALAILGNASYQREQRKLAEADFSQEIGAFYDSDIIERLALALKAQSSPGLSALKSLKPDGSASTVEYKRLSYQAHDQN